MSYNEETPTQKGNTMSSNPSKSSVLMHVVLTFLTGGIWLIVLLIWWLLKK